MPISSNYEKFDLEFEDKKVINNIVESKRVLDPWTMVAETHKTNGAWDQIYRNGLGNHKVIPIDLIKAVG